MTVNSRSRLLLLFGAMFIVSMSAGVPSALAQNSSLSETEQLLAKAVSFERDGKWNDALQLWCKIYGQDRQNDEANRHIQICLRRMFQAQRITDKSLREKVLSLSHSQALAMYTEVLGTLHAAYVDKTKVAPNRLFQQGLEEFLISLNDPMFRKQHLAAIRDKEIREFQTRLRESMTIRVVTTIPDAVVLVKQIAATAKRDLQITQTSVVVLEFIGGACNSLDEYTAYLSPSELLAEAAMESEASVVGGDEYLKDGIGYLRISHFRESTPEEIDTAINTLKMMAPEGMNLKALVLDLRGNTGGLFSAAVQVVERFVPQGVIVSTQGQLDEFNKVHNSGARMNVIDLPLIVLVDGSTASAAEVLAGAFRDHRRATLVGTPTYGKGSIQRILQFQTAEELDENGKPKPRTGGVRITLARFFSPNGQAVNGSGIAPHIVEQDKMRQLEVGLEQAARYVSGMTPR